MNGTPMEWLTCVTPRIGGSAGARAFTEPVINPLRVIYDHELFLFSTGAARMVV